MLVKQGDNMRKSMENQQAWIKKFAAEEKHHKEALSSLSKAVAKLQASPSYTHIYKIKWVEYF